MPQPDLFDTLIARNLIQDVSRLGRLRQALASGPVTVYAGFDPTAASLHAGHLVTLTVLRLFADAGHTVLPLLGDATAHVGDPTGRSVARPVMDMWTQLRNAEGVEACLKGILGVEPGRNSEWLNKLAWPDFLADIASKLPLSRLTSLQSTTSRTEGMSLMEFCYPLMQGYDFLTLARRGRGQPLVQVGGSDQWGNICVGLDLCAKHGLEDAYGLTHPLLTNADGRKMGKSEGGAVWLSREQMSPTDFYRFWRSLPDRDVPGVVRMLAPQAECMNDVNATKERLAVAMTTLVHGATAADEARTLSQSHGFYRDGMPVSDVRRSDCRDILDLALLLSLIDSRSAGRRLIAQGGLYMEGVPVAEGVSLPELGAVTVLSAGKTRHVAVTLV